MLLFDMSQLVPSGDEFVQKLFPGGWMPVVTQLIATAIIVAVFFIFFFKPVRKILDTRAKNIEDNINESVKSKKSANALFDEAQKNITTSKVEAENIISKALIDATNLRENMVEETKIECEKIKLSNDEDIKRAKEKAQDEIEKEIVNVAILATSKVLEREVSNKDNEELIKSFIKDVEK